MAKVAEGEDQAAQILAEAREQAADLAKHTEVIRVAEAEAAKIRADAEEEAAALRRETDTFIDSRMASFESVLHKTTSQVSDRPAAAGAAQPAGRPRARRPPLRVRHRRGALRRARPLRASGSGAPARLDDRV